MSIEFTGPWEDTAIDPTDELIDYQDFAESIWQEGLDDPLINQGYQHKDSLFLEVFRCEAAVPRRDEM